MILKRSGRLLTSHKPFDQLSGQRTNLDKTTTFATSAAASRSVSNIIPELVVAKHDVALGFDLPFLWHKNFEKQYERIKLGTETIRLIRYLPVPREIKLKLLAGKAGAQFGFGSEYQGLPACSISPLRTIIIQTVFGKGRLMRSPEVVLSLLHKGHLIEPAQIPTYRALKLARNTLQRREDCRLLWVEIWNGRQEWPRNRIPGVVGFVTKAVLSLGGAWIDAFTFSFNGCHLSLLDGNEDHFLHTIRIKLRNWRLNLNPEPTWKELTKLLWTMMLPLSC